jgi:hypothetical protein
MVNRSRTIPLILLAVLIASVSAALAAVAVTAREPVADHLDAPEAPPRRCDSQAVREDLRLLKQRVNELLCLAKAGTAPDEGEHQAHCGEHLAYPESPTRDPGITRLNPGNYGLVRSAGECWEEDDGFRREWLFRPTSEALTWFGAPDQVIAGRNGQEYWKYHWPSNDPDDRGRATLQFHNGRLIAIDDY